MSDQADEQPHDLVAERYVLAGILQFENVIPEVLRVLGEQPGEWDHALYRPAHWMIYRAIVEVWDRGQTPDVPLVVDELDKRREINRVGGATTISDLFGLPVVPANVGYHARIVAEHHRSREALKLASRIDQAARQGSHDMVRKLVDEWVDEQSMDPGSENPATATELDDLLAVAEEDTYNWIIRDFLERRDRLILTGPEGGGKSTFIRQVGTQAASGIHPLDGSAIDPLRVLHVDLENSEDQCRRELRPLRIAAGDRYQRGQYHLRARPEGIDLTAQQDRDWLFRLAESINPDLLTIGPIYKMANGDPTEETSAKPVAVTLDKLRVQVDCGLLIEAHPPKTTNGGRRAIEPYGWSGWLRWPEFGMHLAKDGQITHWRGQRDARRVIPAAMQRGGEWPWTPLTRPRDVLWARIRGLCIEAGDQLSYRDLAKMTGSSVGAVQKAIDEHRPEWDELEAAE